MVNSNVSPGEAGRQYQQIPRPQPGASQTKIPKNVLALIVIVGVVMVGTIGFLYVAVIGFPDPPGEYTIEGNWENLEVVFSDSVRLTFGSFTKNETQHVYFLPTEIRIFIKENGTDIGYVQSVNDTTHKMNWTDGPPGADVSYTINYALGGTVHETDYITLMDLKPGSTYSFEVLHVPTNIMITMSGPQSEITIPMG